MIEGLKYKGVKINNKKVENLTENDLKEIPVDLIEQIKHDTEKKEKEKAEKILSANFKRQDFSERARREYENKHISARWEDPEEQREITQMHSIHKENYEKNIARKKPLELQLNFMTQYLEKK